MSLRGRGIKGGSGRMSAPVLSPSHEHSEDPGRIGCGGRGAGVGVCGKGGRLKLVPVALVVALSCCGGETIIESSSDSGGGGHGGSIGSGGSSGGGGASATGGSARTGGSAGGVGGGGGSGGADNLRDSGESSTDGGVSLPEVGSPGCFMQNGSCVLCSDNKWHCDGNLGFASCPSDVKAGSPCPYLEGGFLFCITCNNNGLGDQFSCTSSGGVWSPAPIMCVPQ
jgi:hypothetical protein